MPVVIDTPTPVVVSAVDIAVPDWVSLRGGDVRAYNRSLEREVFGPSHPYPNTTDLLLTNGLVRFWVGNRGMIPFLNVDAFASGSWRHSGVLALAADDSDDVLLNARTLSVTPDLGTVALDVLNSGPIYLTLQRGERMIRVQHGSDRDEVSAARYVRWLAAPPTRQLSTATAAGKFNAGHRQNTGDTSSEFLWPTDVRDGFTLAYWWLPAAGSASQAQSGLASLWDTSETRVLHSRFDTSDNRAKVTVGATTIQSSALTFAANDPVFVALRFSTSDGLALSVKTPTGTLEHVIAPSVVSLGVLDLLYLAFRTTGAGTWGGGTYGGGTWGGLITGLGTFDNLQIFDGYLSNDIIASLASAASALDGITGIEGRLRWFAPFDVVPSVGALSGGRMVESSAGADGLKRMLASLGSVYSLYGGLASVDESADYLAALLDDETAASVHNQFASAYSQEVRVR